ncbi:MAG: transketolase C-terminal domain-containing protein, partial [Elusimicrobiota bacterium]
TKKLVTVEDNARAGGFGSAVLEALADSSVPEASVLRLGIPDSFVMHGAPAKLYESVGLDAAGIAARAAQWSDRGLTRGSAASEALGEAAGVAGAKP